jgi:hypothetical protein
MLVETWSGSWEEAVGVHKLGLRVLWGIKGTGGCATSSCLDSYAIALELQYPHGCLSGRGNSMGLILELKFTSAGDSTKIDWIVNYTPVDASVPPPEHFKGMADVTNKAMDAYGKEHAAEFA